MMPDDFESVQKFISNLLQKSVFVCAVLTVYVFTMVCSQNLLSIITTYTISVQSTLQGESPKVDHTVSTEPESDNGASTNPEPKKDELTGTESNNRTSTDFTYDLKDSNPNVEQFAHSLIQLLQTSKALGLPGNFRIYDIYERVFVSGYTILLRLGITNPSLAEDSARVSEEIGFLDINLYYSTVSHTLAKTIDLKGKWTQDLLTKGPRHVLELVEVYARENGASDAKSVLHAVHNGVFDFGCVNGLISNDNVALTFRLYDEYAKRLANGDLE